MMEAQFDRVCQEVDRYGYSVWSDALTPEEVQAICEEIDRLQRSDAFRKAGIGKEQDFQINAQERGDFIHWITPEQAAACTQVALERLRELIQFLNRHLYLGIRDMECHYAFYPKGAGYKRHVDRHRHQSHRIISVVLYLNTSWKEGDGGELLLYPAGGNALSIQPKAGTLAIFLSDLEHEVLPTAQPRYSITGWLLDEQLFF